jgi:O-antigen/teichoic acid export membrane protein
MSGPGEEQQTPPDGDAVEEPTGTHSIASGSTLMVGQQLLGAAGYFISVLLLARALGPTGRGTVAFFIVVAMVTSRVVALGVWEATTVFAAQRRDKRGALLTNVFLFSGIGGLIGGAIAVGALLIFEGARPEDLDTPELVALGLGIFGTALSEAALAFLFGCSRFLAAAVCATALPWTYTLLIAFMVVGPGLSVSTATIAWTAAALLGALMMVLVSVRGVRPGAADLALLLESVHFGVRAWVGTLSRFLNFRVDQIFIALIASEAVLGIYAVAVNASEVLLYVPNAASWAVLPLVAASGHHERAGRTLGAFRAVALITAVGIVVAALLGPPLLPLVFGEDFEPATLPFLILLPGALGFAASAIFSSGLAAANAPGLSSVGLIVSLFVGIALDLVLIAPFGAEGAAAAATAAFLAGGAVSAVIYVRLTGSGWRSLLPRRSDLAVVGGVVARLRRRPDPAAT